MGLLLEQIRAWFGPVYAEQTEDAARQLWRIARADVSHRHPFHREVLDDLERNVELVPALSADEVIEIDDLPVSLGQLDRHYPQIARSLTPAYLREFAAREVERVEAVASSNDYLHNRSTVDTHDERTAGDAATSLRRPWHYSPQPRILVITPPSTAARRAPRTTSKPTTQRASVAGRGRLSRPMTPLPSGQSVTLYLIWTLSEGATRSRLRVGWLGPSICQ